MVFPGPGEIKVQGGWERVQAARLMLMNNISNVSHNKNVCNLDCTCQSPHDNKLFQNKEFIIDGWKAIEISKEVHF